MANDFYAVTGSPSTGSSGSSAVVRSEFTAIQSGFDKLPTITGNSSKLIQVNAGATALVAVTLTVGALLFGGAVGVLGQDGTNLFWDNAAKRLGIGNAAPTVALDVTGAIKTSTTLFTPIIDSGTTGSLSLRTNNGTTGLQIEDVASGVNALSVGAGAAGNNVSMRAQGVSANIGIDISPKGTGQYNFFSDNFSITQFQILRTASSSRNITVTGSNGGNPTLSTTAGSLAITPAVVCASTISATALIVGATNPAASGDIRVVNGAAFNGRNTGNTADKTFLTYNDGALTLSPSGDDIKWGKALVALGGGAAPTFGTIGGTGPATAAQNTWMRILDSVGVPFWVPAWK